MTETLPQVQRPPLESEEREGPPATGQAGAVLFAELVWAHYWWEQERHWHKEATDPDTERRYRAKLEEFEREQGRIIQVYWSTRAASAVALTETQSKRRRKVLRIVEDDREIRLHRVSDWVTKASPRIADMLHQCDLLAIRVSEILRGTSERIAMRWILAVQAHLLGFLERSERLDGEELEKQERETVRQQLAELVKIEDYYHRAATKAGRIVYVSGMLLGMAMAAIAAPILAVILWIAGMLESGGVQGLETTFVCYGAGAIGALVSALSRMGNGPGTFNVDFEIGRPLLRRLGVYKPFVGAIFGVATYFLLASELLASKEPNEGQAIYFYGIVAFFAGFSERFTVVIFGNAQRMFTKDDAEPVAQPEPRKT
jgi:hypothetical protein